MIRGVCSDWHFYTVQVYFIVIFNYRTRQSKRWLSPLFKILQHLKSSGPSWHLTSWELVITLYYQPVVWQLSNSQTASDVIEDETWKVAYFGGWKICVTPHRSNSTEVSYARKKISAVCCMAFHYQDSTLHTTELIILNLLWPSRITLLQNNGSKKQRRLDIMHLVMEHWTPRTDIVCTDSDIGTSKKLFHEKNQSYRNGLAITCAESITVLIWRNILKCLLRNTDDQRRHFPILADLEHLWI